MFISHTYQAIFVHIQRTGGNSIQAAFEAHDPALVETIAPDPARRRTKHCYASDIAAVVGPDLLRSYTTFAVVRNPFERLASWYAHLVEDANPGDLAVRPATPSATLALYHRGMALVADHPRLALAWRRAWAGAARAVAPDSPEEVALRFEAIGAQVKREVRRLAPTFDAFVALPREHEGGLFERFYANQLDYLCEAPGAPSPLLVKHVLRFETLAADFAALAVRIGFPGRLPHVNAARGDRPYQALYSPEARAAVAGRFARDCAHFGYSFEGGGR